MSEIPDHFVLVCTRCAGALSSDALRDMLTAKLPSGFAIRGVPCMAGCAHPGTVGFQAVGKAQYLFGDIQTVPEVDALAQFAQQYLDSPDGWTNATERPLALSDKTLSRLPRIESEVRA